MAKSDSCWISDPILYQSTLEAGRILVSFKFQDLVSLITSPRPFRGLESMSGPEEVSRPQREGCPPRAPASCTDLFKVLLEALYL